jgi:hypothetical protein
MARRIYAAPERMGWFMQDDIVGFIGILLLIRALATSHSLPPQRASLLGDRVAQEWHELVASLTTCATDEGGRCRSRVGLP